MASKSRPSVSWKIFGLSTLSSLSFLAVQGRSPLLSCTPKLAAEKPTGTTPRARTTSWLAHWMVATRSGFLGMVVSPKACLITMGYWVVSLGAWLAAGAGLLLAAWDGAGEEPDCWEAQPASRAMTIVAMKSTLTEMCCFVFILISFLVSSCIF
ncbi:hypothetical protein D3C75_1066550 [compost metagenome]